MEKEIMRLCKLMAQRGICSRREAEALIEQKLVAVDGEIIEEQGVKVAVDVKIDLLPRARALQSAKVTILLNKPVGYVSSQPEKGYRPAIELITDENRVDGGEALIPSNKRKLAVCGRLDIDSKGLLVFTQDGVLAKKLIGENCGMEKEYLVYVDAPPAAEALARLQYGITLDGKPLKRAKVDRLSQHCLRFVLREGKKRQIRRMCEEVGLEVTGLKRVRIGKIMLGDLPEGKWRYLRVRKEITTTFQLRQSPGLDRS